MNEQYPKFELFGDQAILINWEEKIDEDLLDFILWAKDQIEKRYHPVLIELVNTYHSLLIKYDSSIKIENEIPALQQLILGLKKPPKRESTLYHLPVCYDKRFGFDLENVAATNNIKPEQIPELHTAPVYTIYFIGFLPGFLYLGGLDKKLFCDRKNIPRKKVNKGAVGIGGKQTGIYPNAAPGGWQLIGNCPLPMFEANHDPPTPFKPGDRIKFYSISFEVHQGMLKEVEKGIFQLKKESYVR